MFCGFRPLTLAEIATALFLERIDTRVAVKEVGLSDGSLAQLKRRIIDLSGGLFETVGGPTSGRVQVIHESVREFFLGPKGLRLLRIPSRELFAYFGLKTLVLGCFQALMATEFDEPLTMLDKNYSRSITDTMEFVTVDWQPPENTLLTEYVPDHFFEHFGKFAALQSIPSPEQLFQSAKIRRRAVDNFFRLCCSDVAKYRALRPSPRAQTQMLFIDAPDFNLSNGELAELMIFLNNLSTCVLYFPARPIFKYDPRTALVNHSQTYLALFYVFPRTLAKMGWQIPPQVFFPAIVEEDVEYTLKQLNEYRMNIKFCLAMTFKATERTVSHGSIFDNPPLPLDQRHWEFVKKLDQLEGF
ncbi:hypothetical protein BCR34DRAFT_228330 [Clohesyomyces aquaticus]|uniref:Uncharacterized protein n=1 Tax=Clohesyomyces aquaticus TaxID=1231657 RepID=A0A1Y1ZWW6_9PLEO|nr:hypothetical protein BCR34DRAFT_228330 [Clohesyomyces aquaticus]